MKPTKNLGDAIWEDEIPGPDDPIYQQGWQVGTPIGYRTTYLDSPEQPAKAEPPAES